MTVAIIITLCTLLLIAYMFDLTFAKTKIPSVILLLFLGWTVRQITNFINVPLPDLNSVLPILGLIGLVLIVLEGSLELELNKSKLGLIKKSSLGALFPVLALGFLLAYLFHYFGHISFKMSLVYAIPFCVISSAIAIPSVRNLSRKDKEFVIYESSTSDILGVLFFNFVALNANFGWITFGSFSLSILIMIVGSLIATLILSFLLNKIDHHIKFVPIMTLVILIYSISEVFHLPALIFIMIFGLFIGNLDELKRFKWIQRFKPDELNVEVQKFKELVIEGAFLVRAIFFILFGFLLETAEILNPDTMIWAVGIVFLIYLFRAVQLKVSNLPLESLLFIAPRGLITILLFLRIDAVIEDPKETISFVNESLIVQVIVLTAIVMMVALLFTSKSPKELLAEDEAEEIRLRKEELKGEGLERITDTDATSTVVRINRESE